MKVLFTNRIIGQWNHLPSFVVTTVNINLFKPRLDYYWIQQDKDNYKTHPLLFFIYMSILQYS